MSCDHAQMTKNSPKIWQIRKKASVGGGGKEGHTLRPEGEKTRGHAVIHRGMVSGVIEY